MTHRPASRRLPAPTTPTPAPPRPLTPDDAAAILRYCADKAAPRMGALVSILARLRDAIRKESKGNADSGTMDGWADEIELLAHVINEEASELDGALRGAIVLPVAAR